MDATRMTTPKRAGMPRGAVSIGHLAGIVAAPAFKRHGLAHAGIASAWEEIAGPDLGAISRPVRVAHTRPGEGRRSDSGGGVLTVAVAGPRAIEMQHAAPRILEAVNTLLGYRAVSRMRLVRESPGAARRAAPRAPLTPGSTREIQGIASPSLERALARLGRAAGER